jgi:iron complex outermembrane receptor protein
MSGREPNRSDLKDALNEGVATPPRDERLYDFELGYNLLGSQFHFNANLFYMLYDNQIVHSGRLNDSYRAIMENVKDSYRVGIELSGGVRFFDKLKFDASLALSQNKIKDFTSLTPYYDNQNDWNLIDDGYKREHYKNTDIAFSPNVVGGGTIGYEPIKNTGISLGGKYVGGQYFDNTMSKERMIDAYFVMNGNVYYRLNFERVGSITFQLFVNNLLDAKYSTSAYINEYTLFADGARNLETMYFPQAGVNVVGRVVFNF